MPLAVGGGSDVLLVMLLGVGTVAMNKRSARALCRRVGGGKKEEVADEAPRRVAEHFARMLPSPSTANRCEVARRRAPVQTTARLIVASAPQPLERALRRLGLGRGHS